MISLIAFLGLHLMPATAHQPVMDMAPRWNNGYGAQIRYEHYGSDTLLQGKEKVDNPLGLKKSIHNYWLEGVYTFKRSLRVTAKLPYVQQTQTRLINGLPTSQSHQGWGDLILALPLKKYKNHNRGTYNLGLTPQIRIPTGDTGGDFPISDGSTDLSLSLSYSSESYPFHSYPDTKIYQLYDVFYWLNGTGKDNTRAGHILGVDINLGLQPYHNSNSEAGIFTLVDLTYRKQESPNSITHSSPGGQRLHMGPVFILYKGNTMLRLEYKYPLLEEVNQTSLARGQEFLILLGFTG